MQNEPYQATPYNQSGEARTSGADTPQPQPVILTAQEVIDKLPPRSITSSPNPSSIPEPARLSSVRALELLIASEGDLHLAAELGKLPKETGPQLLVAAIVGDENNHDTMARYVRAFTTMKLFSMMNTLQEAVVDAISEEKLKPSDLVRAFANVVEVLNGLTDSKTSTQNINVFETVSKSLPADVREALRIVSDEPDQKRAG